MKVQCINNTGTPHLKLWKLYEVDKETDEIYMIKDEAGAFGCYKKSRFTVEHDFYNHLPDEPTGTTPDPIKPSHYHHGGLDVFTIMDKNMPHQLEGFFVGNVLKYVMRYEHKNGLEDLKKAKEYLEKLIELKS